MTKSLALLLLVSLSACSKAVIYPPMTAVDMHAFGKAYIAEQEFNKPDGDANEP